MLLGCADRPIFGRKGTAGNPTGRRCIRNTKETQQSYNEMVFFLPPTLRGNPFVVFNFSLPATLITSYYKLFFSRASLFLNDLFPLFLLTLMNQLTNTRNLEAI